MNKISRDVKFIFVSGGVISGLGKGIAAASLGMILKQRGFNIEFIKCDPYLNVDAGTMNPIEHGEVFVTDDGYEMDMDAGHYERFLDQPITRSSGITTGKIYSSVIQNERNLRYNGECVEVFPHVIDEIVNRITEVGSKLNVDIVMVEIGGTVGEFQNEIYYEAERRLKILYKNDLIHIHLVYLPVPESIGEMKTKPAQQSIRLLNNLGIFPDILLCRAHMPLDDKRIRKLAVSSGIDEANVFSAVDVSSIYEVPVKFNEQKMSERVLELLELKANEWKSDEWENLINKIKTNEKQVKIGIIGKYFKTGEYNLEDAYASVLESVKHAAWNQDLKPIIRWFDSDEILKNPNVLEGIQGIIVPGGFGSRGVEGKIRAVQYARENKIPYFGLCYGMQLAVVEFSRNVCGMKDATTTEIDPKSEHQVIHVMPEQEKKLLENNYGGTMRLGAWDCKLTDGTQSFMSYGKEIISERHRHRYEFNNEFKDVLTKEGLIIAGTSTDGQLVEIVELPKDTHPFFVGVQFHPEFKSRPLSPHPLFKSFVMEASKIG